ncbi:class II aldolase/adducin family protein [Acuticoccus sp. 2012]|uniref:Class II aldolase/adducin family protein n=2 Tax=Acuticoccus mangrovi TaxID=2796142 RepID=A0A934IDJ3_9HYPH|nr:class II aldolase/adducin family protein [Acuticoccus mangrovi]MBJ3774574.1 class II aldolase/adducin family protein [Acuticoccus mangrovi]
MAVLKTKNYTTDIPSMRDKVSEAEWDARVNLAAAYRLVAMWGMDEMIANHISVAVPGEEGTFLINPYGYFYEEITASSLIKIDLDGNVILKPDFDYEPNRAGFVIHSAIHRARPDAFCVIHTHTPAGMAVSTMDCGLLPLTQTAMRFAKIGYHDYQSVAVDLAEQESIVADLGDADLLILRNHGLLVVGPSVAQAFSNIYRAELACRTQVMAMSANTAISTPPQEIIDKTNHLYRPEVRRPFGVLEWPALLRKLDRHDPSYRD